MAIGGQITTPLKLSVALINMPVKEVFIITMTRIRMPCVR